MVIDNKKIRGHLPIIAIGAALFGLLILLFNLGDEPAEYPIKRVVQYGFEIENRGSEVVRDVEFWTYAPVKLTSTQKFENLTVSHPYELIEDELDNQVIHLKFDVIPPYATKIVTVQAELSMSDTPNPLPLIDSEAFLKAEKYIESEHADIRTVATSFPGDGESDVEAIYNWTADHIQGVAYVREDRGALYALHKKSGDCTEYTYLFTALCRAKGIPARPFGGYVLSENGKLASESYHNWAEFYLDGTWQLADPQMKVFEERPSRFIAMNVISNGAKNPMNGMQRFRFTGKNIFVTMR